MTVGRIPTPSSETVERAMLHVRPQAAAKQIHIAPRTIGDAPVYLGDPHRVEQIITNLLSNAVKFTASGGRISVEWGSGRRPGTTPSGAEWVWMTVSDTGIGIAPDDLARIFQPFVQVENGYTRGKGGTGLGLAISRQLAMIMGGELTVESTLGSGSRFTVWLPSASVRTADTVSKEHAGVS
jgi:signal transduction histidine kinase